MSTERPDARLTQLLLSLFSSDELRRLLRFSFPESLSNSLPGPSQSPAAVAAAAVDAVLAQGLLDELWPRLIAERPRRRPEIEAVQALFAATTQSSGAATARGDGAATRLLYVLSCPPSEVRLNLQEELRQIRTELQLSTHRDRFACEFITAATYADLRKALRTHKPHILHIACHGTSDDRLVFSDGAGKSDPIDARTIAELLELFNKDLALVVLNACNSSAVAREIANHVELVISMNSEIYDGSALAFARTLYESIADGDNAGLAFKLAVNELRRRGDGDVPELLPASGPALERTFVA